MEAEMRERVWVIEVGFTVHTVSADKVELRNGTIVFWREQMLVAAFAKWDCCRISNSV